MIRRHHRNNKMFLVLVDVNYLDTGVLPTRSMMEHQVFVAAIDHVVPFFTRESFVLGSPTKILSAVITADTPQYWFSLNSSMILQDVPAHVFMSLVVEEYFQKNRKQASVLTQQNESSSPVPVHRKAEMSKKAKTLSKEEFSDLRCSLKRKVARIRFLEKGQGNRNNESPSDEDQALLQAKNDIFQDAKYCENLWQIHFS